jgi:hypothetical protein
MFKVICFILVIFVTICLQAQTLPPLPIDSLKKIELKYSDTLIKPFRIDTLHINLYGGNILGGNLFLLQTISKKCLLNTCLEGNKNFDYSDYLYGNGKINLGWLSKNFWHEFALQPFWKTRAQRYYGQLIFSYNPIWFIANGSITFNNQLRGTKYVDTQSNLLLAGRSDWNFNMPSLIGIINGDANILAQSIRKNNYKYWISSAIALTDLITIGDNFFVQPGVNYNIEKKQIEPTINTGIFVAGVKTFINISHNLIKPFYFDTIYSNVYSLLVFDDIDYPLCAWQAGFQLSWKDLQISTNYQRYRSYIGHSPRSCTQGRGSPRDTWLIPQFIEGRYRSLNFGIGYSWRFIKNNIYLNYTLDEINLIPRYNFSDSMLINVGRFDFGTVVFISDKRMFDNQMLKSYITLSSEIGFNWKSIRPYIGVDNILDKRYEIFPTRFALGRKYFVGLEYYSKNKSRVK